MAIRLQPVTVLPLNSSEGLKEQQLDSEVLDKSSKPCSSQNSAKRKRENDSHQRDISTAAKKTKTGNTHTNSRPVIQAEIRAPVHRMQTRSQTAQQHNNDRSGIHLCDLDAVGSAAASDEPNQKRFLQLMGMVSDFTIPVSDTDLLDDNEASILAAANQHLLDADLKEESHESVKNDGYYTIQTMRDTWKLVAKTKTAPMCTCVAHQAISGNSSASKEAMEKYRQLIRLPLKVNDDQGKTLAVALIKRIFEELNIYDKTVTSTEMGTEWVVNFVLMDTATSEKISFRGWGDFCICHQEVNAGADQLLVTVGEVESKGTDTLAKLGIYSIGQFRKKSGVLKRYLPSVGIYKDKSAIVCIAERIPPQESQKELSDSSSPSTEDLGRVTFKIVEGAERLDLKCAEDVKEFARRLIGTIRFAMQNS